MLFPDQSAIHLAPRHRLEVDPLADVDHQLRRLDVPDPSRETMAVLTAFTRDHGAAPEDLGNEESDGSRTTGLESERSA